MISGLVGLSRFNYLDSESGPHWSSKIPQYKEGSGHYGHRGRYCFHQIRAVMEAFMSLRYEVFGCWPLLTCTLCGSKIPSSTISSSSCRREL